MILLNLLHLIIVANTVNCSFLWFLRAPATADDVYLESGSGNVVIIEEVPVKPIVVLSESEDEEKQNFHQELADQMRHSAELSAASRARYLAALPKEHDSMEMISAEASLTSQFMDLVDEQRKRIGKIWDHVRNLKYGHSQYSDSEAEAEDEDYIVEEVESSSSDEEGYLRYVVGEEAPLKEPVEPFKSDEDAENFEVVENPDELMNTLF
jgi:hypothetical protein